MIVFTIVKIDFTNIFDKPGMKDVKNSSNGKKHKKFSKKIKRKQNTNQL
jgi:hypothetical protein